MSSTVCQKMSSVYDGLMGKDRETYSCLVRYHNLEGGNIDNK